MSLTFLNAAHRINRSLPSFASVTVLVLVPLLLAIFFFIRQRCHVRFELVPHTVTTTHTEDEPVSTPPDSQPRPLLVPPRKQAPRPSSMQKDASPCIDTDTAAEQQSLSQASPWCATSSGARLLRLLWHLCLSLHLLCARARLSCLPGICLRHLRLA